MHTLLVAYVVVALAHLVLNQVAHSREGFDDAAPEPSASGTVQKQARKPALRPAPPADEQAASTLEQNVRDMYDFVYSDADASVALDKFFNVAGPEPDAAPAKIKSDWPPVAADDDSKRIEQIYQSRRMEPVAKGGGAASHPYEVVAEYDEVADGIGGFDGSSVVFAGVDA